MKRSSSFFIYLECECSYYEITIFEKPLSFEQKRLSAFESHARTDTWGESERESELVGDNKYVVYLWTLVRGRVTWLIHPAGLFMIASEPPAALYYCVLGEEEGVWGLPHQENTLTHKHMRQWYLNEHPIIPLAGKPVRFLLSFKGPKRPSFYYNINFEINACAPLLCEFVWAWCGHAVVDRKGDADKGLTRCARPWKMRSAGQLECHAVMQALPLLNWIPHNSIHSNVLFPIVIKTAPTLEIIKKFQFSTAGKDFVLTQRFTHHVLQWMVLKCELTFRWPAD